MHVCVRLCARVSRVHVFCACAVCARVCFVCVLVGGGSLFSASLLQPVLTPSHPRGPTPPHCSPPTLRWLGAGQARLCGPKALVSCWDRHFLEPLSDRLAESLRRRCLTSRTSPALGEPALGAGNRAPAGGWADRPTCLALGPQGWGPAAGKRPEDTVCPVPSRTGPDSHGQWECSGLG